MDNKTKRRLIYAIIIIAIVVIFLPIPFSKHQQPQTSAEQTIPQKPHVLSPQTVNQTQPQTAQSTTDTSQTNDSQQASNDDGFQATTPVMPETNAPTTGNATTTTTTTTATTPPAAATVVTTPATQTPATTANTQTSATTTDKKNAQTPVTTAPVTAPSQTAQTTTVTPASTAKPVAAATTTKPATTQAATSAPTTTAVHQQAPTVTEDKNDTSFMNMSPENAVKLANTPDATAASLTQQKQQQQKVFTEHIPQSVTTDTKPKKVATTSAQAVDDSPVVENFSGGDKNIVVQQSELTQMPHLNIRHSSASSDNVAQEQQPVPKQQLDAATVAKRLDAAWIVQLASFPDLARSRAVVTKLRENGYAAFSQESTVKGKTMYRVYVGPFTREQQAEALLHLIDQKMRMQGYIHHFDAANVNLSTD